MPVYALHAGAYTGLSGWIPTSNTDVPNMKLDPFLACVVRVE